MKRFPLILLLGFFLVHHAAAQDGCGVDLFVPRGNLVPKTSVKTDDVLLGLYKTNIGYLLIPSKISIDFATDEGNQKIMNVIVPNTAVQPLFLVSGLNDLQAGLVRSICFREKFLYPGEVLSMGPDHGANPESGYFLRSYGKVFDKGNKTVIQDYAVKLSRADKSQILALYRGNAVGRTPEIGILDITDPMSASRQMSSMDLPVLIWAGDLDRDDKPDMFMWWPCPGKPTGGYTLFLSSAAKRGDLVATVVTRARKASASTECSGDSCMK